MFTQAANIGLSLDLELVDDYLYDLATELKLATAAGDHHGANQLRQDIDRALDQRNKLTARQRLHKARLQSWMTFL
jgi:hypothetical protein